MAALLLLLGVFRGSNWWIRRPLINELLDELDASLLDVLPQISWMRRAPKVSSSASTHALRVVPARS